MEKSMEKSTECEEWEEEFLSAMIGRTIDHKVLWDAVEHPSKCQAASVLTARPGSVSCWLLASSSGSSCWLETEFHRFGCGPGVKEGDGVTYSELVKKLHNVAWEQVKRSERQRILEFVRPPVAHKGDRV